MDNGITIPKAVTYIGNSVFYNLQSMIHQVIDQIVIDDLIFD